MHVTLFLSFPSSSSSSSLLFIIVTDRTLKEKLFFSFFGKKDPQFKATSCSFSLIQGILLRFDQTPKFWVPIHFLHTHIYIYVFIFQSPTSHALLILLVISLGFWQFLLGSFCFIEIRLQIIVF